MSKIKTVLKALTPVIASSAILAPVLTSCDSKTKTNFVYSTNNLDWSPTKQTKLEKIRNLQATKEYFRTIVGNKQIFADDIGYFLLRKNRKLTNWSFEIKNIVVTNSTRYLVSFDTVLNNNNDITYSHFRNIELMVHYNHAGWEIIPRVSFLLTKYDKGLALEYLAQNQDWTMSFGHNGAITHYSWQTDFQAMEEKQILDLFNDTLFAYSYYFEPAKPIL